MKRKFSKISSSLLRTIRDGTLLLGVAGFAENLFQSGSVLSALAGTGFLIVSFVADVYYQILGESK